MGNDKYFALEKPLWYAYIVDDATRAYQQAVSIDGYENVSVGYYIEAAVEKAIKKARDRHVYGTA